jgi:ABC-type sugar transport system ATPase subunit
MTARQAGCYAPAVMPSDASAISTTNLTKRYGAVTALAGIDLVVPRGVTYGFLGPNGAARRPPSAC